MGSGYTVQEMCELARSALPAQRAFACRHLAAILARTQRSLRGDPTSKAGDAPQVICLPQIAYRLWAPAQEHKDLTGCVACTLLWLFGSPHLT